MNILYKRTWIKLSFCILTKLYIVFCFVVLSPLQLYRHLPVLSHCEPLITICQYLDKYLFVHQAFNQLSRQTETTFSYTESGVITWYRHGLYACSHCQVKILWHKLTSHVNSQYYFLEIPLKSQIVLFNWNSWKFL